MNSTKTDLMGVIETSFVRLRFSRDEAGILELQNRIDLFRSVITAESDSSILDRYDQRFFQLISRGGDVVAAVDVGSSSSAKASSSSGGSGSALAGEMTTGSKSQKANRSGHTETCSATTMSFLLETLTRGSQKIDPARLDAIVDRGNESFAKLAEKAAEVKAEAGLEEAAGDLVRGTRISSYDAHEAFSESLVLESSPASVKVATPAAFRETLGSTIQEYLTPFAIRSPGHRVGTTLTFNEKTYALSMEIQEKERTEYLFFDSHGIDASGGNAYMLKTNNLEELLESITQIVDFRGVVDPGLAAILSPADLAMISKPVDGQNELGFVVVSLKPAESSCSIQ